MERYCDNKIYPDKIYKIFSVAKILISRNLSLIAYYLYCSFTGRRSAPVRATVRSDFAYLGGAWKVAYADFVTAMMAFFLLLWLLATTSEETKEGLAEYFTPTIGIKDELGIGLDGGISQTDDGVKRSELAPPGIVEGRPQQGVTPEVNKQSTIEGSEDAKLFEQAEQEMRQAIESDPNLREFADNIIIEQTPEGLKLELRDSEDKPMFEPGSSTVSQFGKKILTAMVPLINKLPNHISITGHTDATPLNREDYSNWELSSDRAQSARRFMIKNNLPEEKVAKIIGRAAQDLLDPQHPGSARNRRIEIILLKGSHLQIEDKYQAAPRALTTPPRPNDILKKHKKKTSTIHSRTPSKTNRQQQPAGNTDNKNIKNRAKQLQRSSTILDIAPLPPVAPTTAR